MITNEPATCALCGGPGWIIEMREGKEVAVRCPDCRPSDQARNRRLAADIPPRYLNQGFPSFVPEHRLQEQALKLAIDYVEEFPAAGGLLFVGPCGVGKTHLAVAILEALVVEKNVRGRFVDETELLRRLQYSYGPGSNETEREVLLPLRDADLLVWDDLGASRSTEWVRETIRMVINHRYTFDKATIFTTNRSSDSDSISHREESLEERIGLRLYSRVMEMCRVIQVDGPDARRSRNPAGKGDARGPQLPGEIRCPKCQSERIEVTDSRDKTSELGAMRDLACHCQSCSLPFAVRFYPAQNRVEYHL